MAEVFREAVMEPVAVMEVYVVESLNAGPTGWSPVRLEVVDGTLVLHTGPYMNADRSREFDFLVWCLMALPVAPELPPGLERALMSRMPWMSGDACWDTPRRGTGSCQLTREAQSYPTVRTEASCKTSGTARNKSGSSCPWPW